MNGSCPSPLSSSVMSALSANDHKTKSTTLNLLRKNSQNRALPDVMSRVLASRSLRPRSVRCPHRWGEIHEGEPSAGATPDSRPYWSTRSESPCVDIMNLSLSSVSIPINSDKRR